MPNVGYNIVNPPGVSVDLNAASMEADKMRMLKRQETEQMWKGIFDLLSKVQAKREATKSQAKMEEQIKNLPEGYEVKQTYKIDPATGKYEPSYEIATADPYKQMMAALYKKQQEGGGGASNIRVKPTASGFTMDEMFTPEKIAQAKGTLLSKGIFSPLMGTTTPIGNRQDAENYLNTQLGPGWKSLDPELEAILEQSYPSAPAALPSITLPSGQVIDQQSNVERYGQRVPPPQANMSPYARILQMMAPADFGLFNPKQPSQMPVSEMPVSEPVKKSTSDKYGFKIGEERNVPGKGNFRYIGNNRWQRK